MSSRIRIAAVVVLAALAAATMQGAPAKAQQGVPLVCQTPGFWCTIPAPYLVNGAPCYCNSQWGPINGFTIIPPTYQAPQQSYPQPQQGTPQRQTDNRRKTQDDEQVDVAEVADDCQDGLGNCQGSFSTAMRRARNNH